MNDEILQHHFDEVFSALQDKENFEIFTKIKPAGCPRIKKTFFKIVTPSQVNSTLSFDEVGILGNTARKLGSPLNSKFSPYTSRPSSASNTFKARITYRPPSQKSSSGPIFPTPTTVRPDSPRRPSRPQSPRSMSSGPIISRPASSKRQFSRPMSPRPYSPGSVSFKSLSQRTMSQKTSNMTYVSAKDDGNDILGECRHCGRYFLGDYLTVHEEKCKQESFR